jgi:DNA topoisomerase-1
VPRRYNFDNLTQQDVNELIAAKLEKEANRYIQQWPELKLSIENGRWGPYIRFGKKMLKLGKPGKSKYTPEEAAAISLDEVKAMVEAQVPGAFEEKISKAAPKKAASKAASKSAASKAGAKKAAPKKATAQKGSSG